jgi:hypothetical protein
VRTRLWLLVSLSAALLAVPPTAGSHLPHGSKGTLKTAERNLAHAKGACAAYRKVRQARSPRSHCGAIPWLKRVRERRALPDVGYWAAIQIHYATLLARDSRNDPWPNCPDPGPRDNQGPGHSWFDTVACENGGNWLDSPGYYRCGLQFDPGWERHYGRKFCP